MNNYPANFDNTKVDCPNTDDLCPKCEQENMVLDYWWKNGTRLEPNGDCVCPTCGYREVANLKILV